ncbi:isochorismatase family protein [Pseudonocardia sp. TRM90224]|uniref:isochorismatase family protein n=1 Tax=Pseudonocardia sp. TRM90224 TaxID=2812678 RepID=UPI001E58CC26|nr:isochorismatase family protein [Pseudonocardia sp. TRM90224]
MSTLDNRSSSAVLLIDPQIGVLDGAYERDAVIAALERLVERARGAGVPVGWVQHNDDHVVRGTDGWKFVPELAPGPGEPLIEKSFADACVRSTIHGGLTRGYDVTLVGDAHTTGDHSEWGAPPPGLVIAHTNLYWSEQAAPGRTAGTATADAVDLGTADVGPTARA